MKLIKVGDLIEMDTNISLWQAIKIRIAGESHVKGLEKVMDGLYNILNDIDMDRINFNIKSE